MKKVLIMGADIPMGSQIAKVMFEKERGISIVTNNHEIKDVMRSEWLLKNEDIEPLITITDKNGNYFDKPKSKYHK
jgi:hypothetical protein